MPQLRVKILPHENISNERKVLLLSVISFLLLFFKTTDFSTQGPEAPEPADQPQGGAEARRFRAGQGEIGAHQDVLERGGHIVVPATRCVVGFHRVQRVNRHVVGDRVFLCAFFFGLEGLNEV